MEFIKLYFMTFNFQCNTYLRALAKKEVAEGCSIGLQINQVIISSLLFTIVTSITRCYWPNADLLLFTNLLFSICLQMHKKTSLHAFTVEPVTVLVLSRFLCCNCKPIVVELKFR